MLVPIGDTPNPRGLPYVTYALIAANVAVYLLVTVPLSNLVPDLSDPSVGEYLRVMVPALGGERSLQFLLRNLSSYDLFVFAHGFRPAEPQLTDLFASLFMHAGLFHLAGNMLFLGIYGNNVEHRLGPGGYLLAYLGTGVAASVVHAATAPDSPIPTVGASGAISGLLGFYFVFFPQNQVRLLWLFPPFFLNVFLVPARIVLGMYLIADNLLPFLFTSSAAGVAYGAHIGGFIAGLGVAWMMPRRSAPVAPRAPSRRAKVVPLHPEQEIKGGLESDLAGKIARGDFGAAAVEYFSVPPTATQRLLAPEDGLKLAAWLRRNGHSEASLTVVRRLLRDYPTGPLRADVHVAAGMILLEDLDEPTAAYQHFLDALDLSPAPDVEAAARRGLHTVTARQRLRHARRRD